MKQKIMSNLSYVLCAAMGVLHFILLAFRYFSAFTSFDGERLSEGYSGYNLMKFDIFKNSEAQFCGVLSGIFQILIMVLAIGLLAFGVLYLLKAFGLFDLAPDQIAGQDVKKIAGFGLVGYAGLNVLLLIFLIIWASANTQTVWGVKMGISLSAGIFITLVLGLAAAAAPIALPIVYPALFEDGPQMQYVCTQCGRKANKSEQFCNTCGGTIAREEVKRYDYVCEKCGKKSKKTDKFCNECGGRIVAEEVKRCEYICSGCGKKAKKTDKFCNVCGGAIIEKEIVSAPAAHAAPVERTCPNCGQVAGENDRFCNNCGTAL